MLATHSPWLKFVSCSSARSGAREIYVSLCVSMSTIRGNSNEGCPSDMSSYAGLEASLRFWLKPFSRTRELFRRAVAPSVSPSLGKTNREYALCPVSVLRHFRAVFSCPGQMSCDRSTPPSVPKRTRGK